MDYEKKYKEALEIARQFSEHPLQEDSSNIVEYIFPELKESEDKEIRKWIIDDIRYNMNNEPLNNSEYKKKAERAIAWLEKQGEQKPIDKAEPKFQNGQWIVWQNKCYKVNYNGCGYELIDQNGLSTSLEYGTVDKSAHLWTIKDAKDGDVLVSPPIKGQEGKEQIFIFKGINSRDYVDNCIEYYCRVYEGVFYENENGNGYMGTTSSPLYPATKEQRNLLFQKIKDAGYKWDEGKKELRKIEQKPQRMISAEAKEAMYDKPTDNDMKEALRMEYEKGRADVLRCIDPDEMVADFYSQPLSKTRSLASIYRQGITDILRKINNNEENSITGTCSINDCGM